jgi:hypothetical protein
MNKKADLKTAIRDIRTRLEGLDELILSIIDAATLDLIEPDNKHQASALKYFHSSQYPSHLAYLESPN